MWNHTTAYWHVYLYRKKYKLNKTLLQIISLQTQSSAILPQSRGPVHFFEPLKNSCFPIVFALSTGQGALVVWTDVNETCLHKRSWQNTHQCEINSQNVFSVSYQHDQDNDYSMFSFFPTTNLKQLLTCFTVGGLINPSKAFAENAKWDKTHVCQLCN